MDINSLKIAIDTRDAITAKDNLDKLGKSSKDLDNNVSKAVQSLSSFRGIIATIATGAVISNYIKFSDTFTTIESRLKLVTKSTQEYTKAQEGLLNISMQTRQSFETTVDLYSKISTSTEKLKLSQDKLLDVVEAINTASLIGGGNQEGIKAALVQLGQGFASGTLRGEELNSVLEQTPRLAKAIADGIGISTGELRAFAETGKLTTEMLTTGLTGQLGKLRDEAKNVGVTFGQAMENMETALTRAAGEFNNVTGLSSTLANGINSLSLSIAKNVDSISELVDAIKLVGTTAIIMATSYKIVNTALALSSSTTKTLAVNHSALSASMYMTGASATTMATGMGTATIASRALGIAMKTIPFVAIAGTVALLVDSFYNGGKSADSFAFSVNKLGSELEMLPFTKRLAEVNVELKKMDEQFKGYSDSQKLMYQGGYDALYKEKTQLESNIKAIENKNTATKKANDEAKTSAMAQATNEKILIDLMDERNQKIAKVKKETQELRKEGGNVVLIAEREAKLIKEINEQYDKKSVDEFNRKQKETADSLEKISSAYQEMAKLGMTEYEKALYDIKLQSIEFINTTGDVTTALKMQSIAEDELNKKQTENNLKELTEAEKKRKEEIDKRLVSLNREYDLKEKQAGLIVDEVERNSTLTKLYNERQKEELKAQKDKGEIIDSYYQASLAYEKELMDRTIFRYSQTGQIIESVSSGMKSTMMDFFDYTSNGFGNLKKLTIDLGNMIYKSITQQMVVNPLVNALSSAATSYFTPSVASAKGNVFESPSLSQYSNSVVSKPTTFAFATGGVPSMGVMGEKNGGSPEAIIPLTRTSNGDLGVKSVNTNSNNGVVKVEVINQTSGEVQVTNTSTRNDLEGTILSIVIGGIQNNKMGMRNLIQGAR